MMRRVRTLDEKRCYDPRMLAKLPAWVVDDATSVRAEVAEWAGLTVAERWHLARLCSEDARWATRASGNAERILAHVDEQGPYRDDRLKVTHGAWTVFRATEVGLNMAIRRREACSSTLRPRA
jgi:hypothetical protein